MKKFLFFVFALILPVLLTNCTGESTDNTVAPKENHPPVINEISVQPDEAVGKSLVQFTCVAYDYDSDQLSYEWKTERGEIIGSGLTIVWRTPNKIHFYDITCTVDDGNGGIVSDTVKLHVTEESPNEAPIITSLNILNPDLSIGDTTSIICNAVDYDNNLEDYSFYMSNEGEMYYYLQNQKQILFKSVKSGQVDITCIVRDNAGLYASQTSTITVNTNSLPNEIKIPSKYPVIKEITISDTIKVNEDVVFKCIADDLIQPASSLVYIYGVKSEISVSIGRPPGAQYNDYMINASESGEFLIFFEVQNYTEYKSAKYRRVIVIN